MIFLNPLELPKNERNKKNTEESSRIHVWKTKFVEFKPRLCMPTGPSPIHQPIKSSQVYLYICKNAKFMYILIR
jgi:hypothetical protein